MNYLESISLSAFIMGGISLIFAIFESIIIMGGNLSYSANTVFYAGFGLWMFFWAIAIGVKSYSRYSR